MAPSVKIRPFEDRDIDAVRYFVGSDIMEAIPLANRAFLRTKMGLAAGLVLLIILTFVTGLYPTWPHLGLAAGWENVWELSRGILSLVPLGIGALVLVAFAEIHHRSVFERALSRRLHQEDLRDIKKYYGAAPASGFYVLDYDGKVIGCLGVDASRPQDVLSHIEGDAKGTATGGQVSNQTLKQRKPTRSASANAENVALIRTLTVSAVYRTSGIDEDLLRFALTKCFAGPSPVQKVEMAIRPTVQAHKVKLAEQFGLKQVDGQVSVEADLIEVPKDAKVALAIPSHALASVWPLDLHSRVWCIDKTQFKHDSR